MNILKDIKFRYYAGIFFLALSFTILSCEKEKIDDIKYGTISGQVFDVDSGDSDVNIPIEGAIVTTTPASSSVTTDSEGRFNIPNLPTGEVIVFINKQDYLQNNTTVNVKENQTTDMVVHIQKNDRKSTIDFLLHSPEQEAIGQEINVELAWALQSEVKFSDTLYDLYLIESNNVAKLIAENIEDSTYTLSGLKYETTYFWQVDLKDDVEGSVIKKSPIWSFKTKAFPDFPIVFSKMDDGIYNIYGVGFDNDSTAINITKDEASSNWMPTYNNSRTKIAFSSNRTLDPQIFLMDKNGENTIALTKQANIGYHNQGIGFCWFDEDTKILYSNFGNLYSIKTDGTGLKLISTAPTGRHFRKVDWNGYTNKIIVQTIGDKIYDGEILLMDADGSNVIELLANTDGREDSPSLSIDGTMFMYTHDASGFQDVNGRQLDSRIYLRNVDGSGDILDLSKGKPEGTNDTNPRFSPNGSQIIFEHSENTLGAKSVIMIMDVDGENRKILLEGEMPFWG